MSLNKVKVWVFTQDSYESFNSFGSFSKRMKNPEDIVRIVVQGITPSQSYTLYRDSDTESGEITFYQKTGLDMTGAHV